MSKGQLMRLPAGVSYRQLDHWVSLGYLKPAGNANPGVGNARQWSEEEIRVAEMIAELRAAGLELAVAAKAARAFAAGASGVPLGPGLSLWRT